MTTRSKFSERQAGTGVAVDVLALSPQARAQSMHIPISAVVKLASSATVVASIPVLTNMKITAGAIAYTTVPAMTTGTGKFQLDYVAVDGSTTTNIVAAVSVLLQTAKVPLVLTMAVTNPAICAAGGSLLLTTVADNTVTTAEVGGGLTIGFERVEDGVINDTNATI